MRKHSKSTKIHKHPISAESRHARSLSAAWLVELLEHNIETGFDFLACLSWSLGSLRPLVMELRREIEAAGKTAHTEAPAKHAALSVKKIRKKNPAESHREQSEAALEALRQVLKFSDEALHRKLDEVLEDHSILSQPFRALATEACRKAARPGRIPQSFKNAEQHLEHLFGLDKVAVQICVFTFMTNAFGPVENYFSDAIGADRFNGRRLLAQMLGISPGTCRKTISELRRLGIIDGDSHYLRMEDKIFDLWDEANPDKAAQLFCRPLGGETLPLTAFPIPREDVEHITALFKPRKGSPKNPAPERPVHILLYGPPGTGKTTFARSLAKHFDLKAWAVPSRYDDEDVSRRASLNACIHLADRHPGAFVLADEAERLLDSNLASGRKSHDKAWINELMEQPGRRIIWVTNQVEHIEQAVRRRFSYSIHFEEPSLAQRKMLWEQILERHKVRGKMDDSTLQVMLKNYTPPAAIINEAVRQAKTVAGRSGKRAFAGSVLRIVEAHDTLRRDGHRRRRAAGASRTFTLDGISLKNNADKSPRAALDTLIQRLKNADAKMRAGDAQLASSSCTMLFYGPPGTGKSALARYLAEALNRDCLIKKASDLLSPYVGESEQNIAAAFRQAERDGSLLVIDEADSFVFSRADAVRSWESSMVNEFLTALEDFNGFCICTTNRRADMDNAAMRRFNFKVEFEYAGPEQIVSLYNALLAPLANGPLDKAEERELAALKSLTPGDFYAVRSRIGLEKEDNLSPEELITELKSELKNKLDKAAKNIGF